MSYAFFINEEYLKDNSPLSGNVEMGQLYPFAKTAEDVYIQEVIGTKLYDRLVTAVTNQSYSANELTVLKKIRNVLVWYTCYEALPFLDTKIRNIGVVQQGGENLQSVSEQRLRDLRHECKTKGDFYMRMLQKWLCENQSVFQEYCCGAWNCSELMPNSTIPNSSDLAIDRNTDNDQVETAFIRKWLNGT